MAGWGTGENSIIIVGGANTAAWELNDNLAQVLQPRADTLSLVCLVQAKPNRSLLACHCSSASCFIIAGDNVDVEAKTMLPELTHTGQLRQPMRDKCGRIKGLLGSQKVDILASLHGCSGPGFAWLRRNIRALHLEGAVYIY